MRLTKRGEYPLRTLIRLGIAKRMEEDVVSASSLALQEKLPFRFLEAILFKLRGAGSVESVRGRYGGPRLAKPMDSIKMGGVVSLIDGRLAPIGCASGTEYEKCSRTDEIHRGLRMLMNNVRTAIANILDPFTPEDVVNVTLRKQECGSYSNTNTRKNARKRVTPILPMVSLLSSKPA